MSSGPAFEPLSTLTTSPQLGAALRHGPDRRGPREDRGGHSVGVLHLAATEGRAIRIREAARRKRLLQARYLSWAIGNRSDLARIGPAGELMAHASLVAAAPTAGYRLIPRTRTASATSSVHPSRLVR